MVIYQKLLPRTKKRGVFYLSLKISSLNRLASYDVYPPGHILRCSDWLVIHLCLITGCARSRLSHRVKNTIREKALVDLGQIGWGVYGCRVEVVIGNGRDGRGFRVSDRGVFGGTYEESVACGGRTLQVQ